MVRGRCPPARARPRQVPSAAAWRSLVTIVSRTRARLKTFVYFAVHQTGKRTKVAGGRHGPPTAAGAAPRTGLAQVPFAVPCDRYPLGVPLPLPTSLSPSKVSSFKDCALAFRLSAIDRLPEVKTLPAAKGTVVHRALELLFWEEPPGSRSLDVALTKLDRAVPEILDGVEYTALALDGDERAALVDDARQLLRNYYELEDPDQVRVIGTELRLSVGLGTLRLSGIIDRLELDADGALVVTDYKTGRAPSESHQQSKLVGVHFYAFLCEEVFGRRPVRIQLLHLREPMSISTTPSDQSIRGLRQQTTAIWSAVERACRTEDFRPKPGFACSWCSYQAYCPARGGDLSQLPPPGDFPVTIARRGAPGAPAGGQPIDGTSSPVAVLTP
jgi:putative RecB family exonuclease